MNSSLHTRRPKSVARRILAILIASFALFSTAQAANAAVVSIWVNDSQTSTTNWIEIAGPTADSASIGSYTTSNGKFTLLSASAAATNGPPFSELNSSTFHVQHNNTNSNEVLQIAIIGTGYTNPTKAPITIKSDVSGTNLQAILTNLTFQSFVDSSNNGNPALLSGVGPGLQHPTIYPTIGGADASKSFTTSSDLGSPYSIAHLSTLTMAGTGFMVSLGGDTTLTATPEPSSIALICMCMTGLGGYSWRRRRQQQQAAAANQSKADVAA
jgi:hypothetical protein